MSYCLNPDCQKPTNNLSGTKFCQHCGSKLLLRERYRAIKLIGQGGFGRTFLAVDEDKPSKPRCVIKQFFPQAQGTDNAQKAAELFEQEAVRLEDLGKHPQIPELLAHFTQDKRQYLLQEFIDGQNLAQVIETEGVFSEAQIRTLLNNLLPVLQFIHTNHVIHRDIKPENIIHHPKGKLVLVDFGAAKYATGTALMKTGTVLGTPEYVAPEQTKGRAIFSSDLYSLGVTCIHLLTQINPFEMFDTGEDTWVWKQYLANTSISNELSRILDKLVETATNRRYQSVEEVIKDLNWQQPNQVATSLPQARNWRCVQTLTTHSGIFAGVLSVAISPNNQIFASGSEDYTIKVWNLEIGQEISTLLGHSRYVRAVTFSPDGEILASGSDDKTVRVWNWKTGQELHILRGHAKEVTTVVISPDGEILASGSDDKTIKLWNLRNGWEISTLVGHSGYIQSVTISPNGRKLASSACDNSIKVWDLRDRKKISTLTGHSSCVRAVTFSRDSQTLISGSDDNKIRVWNLYAGSLRNTLSGHSGRSYGVLAVAISPDNQILASGGGSDKTIKIWHLGTAELLCTLTGHSRGVTSVAFSPDGKTLLSGSYDRTIKIWRCD